MAQRSVLKPRIPLRGAQGFQTYYAGLFGLRWTELDRALRQAPAKVFRHNEFAKSAAIARDTRSLKPISDLPACYELPHVDSSFRVSADSQGLLSGYVMDAASVLAARALCVQPHEDVLDLCAAPGGKALILLESLQGAGTLTLNDRSRRRAQRLRSVLREYAPAGAAKLVSVTTHDARRWGLHAPESYDAILLDAPCSSERHVLSNQAELGKWSELRVRRLAVEQHAMLASAARALRVGGRLVYCTCALAPEENDQVVKRLLRKARHGLRVDPVSACIGEATEYGWQIQPDRHGYGPLYFVRLFRS